MTPGFLGLRVLLRYTAVCKHGHFWANQDDRSAPWRAGLRCLPRAWSQNSATTTICLLHWTSYFSVLLLSHVWNGSNSSPYTKAYCDHTEGPCTWKASASVAVMIGCHCHGVEHILSSRVSVLEQIPYLALF